MSSTRRRQLYLSSTGRADTRPRSRLSHLSPGEKAALTRNLGNSFMTYDEEGLPVPKTAAGALYTAAAYLEAIKPLADDPNAKLHRQQIKSLALAAKAIRQVPRNPGGSRDRALVDAPREEHNHSGRRHHSKERSGSRRRRSRSRSRRSYSSDSYSDREPEPHGALCFTRRVRETRMPKGFKLTSEQPKYTGR